MPSEPESASVPTPLLEPELPQSEPEPWLRNTLTEIDPTRRQILHALELTGEDAARWITSLTDAEMNAHPHGLPSIAFHLRHIARSLDRLLTYAEGHPLSGAQFDRLHSEQAPDALAEIVLAELRAALGESARRIRLIAPDTFNEPRTVGRAALPTTVVGLLIHCAEHTQRHIGQAITTAKLLQALR